MLGNMRLGTRVMLALFGGAAFWILVSIFGYNIMSELKNQLSDTDEQHIPKLETVMKLHSAQNQIKAAERTLLIAGIDQARIDRQKENIKQGMARIEESLKFFESAKKSEEQEALWNKLHPIILDWRNLLNEEMQLIATYLQTKDEKIFSS